MTKEKFVLEQAQLNLKTRLESGDLLVGRSYELIKVNITFLMAELAGFVFAFSKQNWALLCFLLALIAVGYVVCWRLYSNLKPRSFIPVGNQPECLTSQPFYSQTIEQMTLGEAQNYDERIKEAADFNSTASKKLASSVILMLIAPVIGLACSGAYYLVYSFSHL